MKLHSLIWAPVLLVALGLQVRQESAKVLPHSCLLAGLEVILAFLP